MHRTPPTARAGAPTRSPATCWPARSGVSRGDVVCAVASRLLHSGQRVHGGGLFAPHCPFASSGLLLRPAQCSPPAPAGPCAHSLKRPPAGLYLPEPLPLRQDGRAAHPPHAAGGRRPQGTAVSAPWVEPGDYTAKLVVHTSSTTSSMMVVEEDGCVLPPRASCLQHSHLPCRKRDVHPQLCMHLDMSLTRMRKNRPPSRHPRRGAEPAAARRVHHQRRPRRHRVVAYAPSV